VTKIHNKSRRQTCFGYEFEGELEEFRYLLKVWETENTDVSSISAFP
jgi:hypothetical protein